MLHSQYDFVQRIKEVYGLLQDRKSQTLFWDRLRCDIRPTVEFVAALYADSFGLSAEDYARQLKLKEEAWELHKQGKKLLLYGAGGCGNMVAEMFKLDDVPFAGFCDRRAEILNEVQGKPVYLPTYLFNHSEDCYVIITAEVYHKEISDILLEHQFPQDHILKYLDDQHLSCEYFEFPKLFPRGTAFVDGGCYNASTSIQFARWCNGEYSKIFAFEPDERNISICQENAKAGGLRDFQLIPAGLGKERGMAQFAAGSNSSSFVKNKDSFAYNRTSISGVNKTIPIVSLDDVVKDNVVGFIKMDIEGSELSALHGAEKVLRRDKPLLAICVYHRPGDTLAIMDYLHSVVPEYRFWLRHYMALPLETVLYAAVHEG